MMKEKMFFDNETLNYETFPRRTGPVEMWYYEIQPNDGTKYEIMIGWHAGGIDWPSAGDDHIMIVLKNRGWYMFHKNEFDSIYPGNIEYFAEKMRCPKHDAEIIMRFIKNLPAEQAKLLLARDYKKQIMR